MSVFAFLSRVPSRPSLPREILDTEGADRRLRASHRLMGARGRRETGIPDHGLEQLRERSGDPSLHRPAAAAERRTAPARRIADGITPRRIRSAIVDCDAPAGGHLKKNASWLLFPAAALILACGSPDATNSAATHGSGQHSHGGTTHTHAQEAEAESGLSVTAWNRDLELFMEHPLLTVGQPAKFAIHLTMLSDFQPVASGPVLFQFTADGTASKMVTVGDPDVPGIFGPSVTFDRAGSYRLRIEILSDEIEAGLEYGPIQVWESREAAPAAQAGDSSESIAYLKEQQWKLPFATQEVRVGVIRDTLRIPAEARARVGSESIVTSAVAGRYEPPPRGVPTVGARIRKAEDLGAIQLLPADRSSLIDRQLAAGANLSRLLEAAARAKAQVTAETSRLGVAEKELARVRRLVQVQALPSKRLEESESDVEIREAALAAAKESLAAHEAAIDMHLSSEKNLDSIGDRVSVSAPISGYLVDSRVIPGEYVGQAQVLFHIVDLRRVWIVGQIFEQDIARLGELEGGTLELPGQPRIELSSSQLVHVGSMVDRETRTLPVIFETENPRNRIKLGSRGKLHLRTGNEVTGLVIPAGALLLEENQSVVYVQLEGEAFERRLVETGVGDTQWIQIAKGLQAGERIVTLGAYNVALAARSTDVPDHGHVH